MSMREKRFITSSTSRSRSACLRLDRTTIAPCSASASAVALPMPRLAPVTRATRPVRSKRELVDTADTIARRVAISGKAAEDILERIFQPTTKPSAMDQAEETLRHPKRLVYVAMSNKVFYWRAHIQKFVLDSGMVPVSHLAISDLPVAIMPTSEETAQEELRD